MVMVVAEVCVIAARGVASLRTHTAADVKVS